MGKILDMRKNHDKFDEILNKVERQDVKLDFKINDRRFAGKNCQLKTHLTRLQAKYSRAIIKMC